MQAQPIREIREPQVRHAVSFFFALIVATVLVVIAMAGTLSIIQQSLGEQISTAVGALLQALITVLVLAVFIQGHFDWGKTLRLEPCRAVYYIWAVVGALALSTLVSRAADPLVEAMPELMSESLLEYVRISRLDDGGAFLLFALAISLGPGITEELAFRGFILSGFRGRFGALGALLLSSFLFALLHLDPLHIVMVFPLGLFLGYVVVRTGSIYPAIVAHAVNNLVSTAEAALWQAHDPKIDPAQILFSANYPPVVFAVAALALILVLYGLHDISRSLDRDLFDDSSAQ
jgi:membrane protease YdiL (CAAX protease family)